MIYIFRDSRIIPCLPANKEQIIPSKNGKVSIYTVAKAAGVSYGTVSRALNNRRDINPKTRDRILAIAQQLGYVPSPIARSLSTSVTAAFGIIVPGIADPFFMPIAKSIEQAARKIGHATLLQNTGRSAATALEGASILAQFRVSGVVILGGSQQKDAEIARILDGIPTVMVLRRGLDGLFPAVYIDHAAGARQIVAHLLRLGRKRIAFVSGDDDSVAATERFRGYRDALQNAELPIVKERIVSGGFTIAGGIAATEQLLALPPQTRPDAIFYASDAMALAGMHTLHAAGIRIPTDIAVAGYGNINFAAISEPPLTTIRMSKTQIGQIAAQLLIQMMQAPSVRPEDVPVEVELVVRGSTTPPPQPT